MKKTVILFVLFSVMIVLPAGADNNSDLIDAAKQGDVVSVQVLLGQGADVNATEKYGWTPLLWAAVNGHTEVVKLLLDSGAKVNVKNELGWTSLEYAKLKDTNKSSNSSNNTAQKNRFTRTEQGKG